MQKINRIGAVSMVIVALFALVISLAKIGSPAKNRSLVFDKDRIVAISEIASKLNRAVQSAAKSRGTTVKVPDSPRKLVNTELWQDPRTQQDYGFRKVSEYEYEICGTFENDSEELVRKYGNELNHRWKFKRGVNCFKIDIRFKIEYGDSSGLEYQ
ncbi:MAG: hypothetical protein K8R88_00460 [Armatimonadetes bacterium]|nr:hypothetical protein [Armatimonadota bacterium]